jgi:hypothetical protein
VFDECGDVVYLPGPSYGINGDDPLHLAVHVTNAGADLDMTAG